MTVIIDDVSFNMIPVSGSTFRMGATKADDSNAEIDEEPVHMVTLDDYYIGKTEVTQALWEKVMGNNPSSYKANQNPVEQVSWRF